MNSKAIYLAILSLGLSALYLKTLQGSRVSYLRLAERYADQASIAFERNGYIVQSEGRYILTVRTPECLARIAPSQADGDNDAIFSKSYAADADIVFDFQSQNFSSRPNFKIFLGRIKARLGGIIGIDWSLGPVWTLSISRFCSDYSRRQLTAVLRNISYHSIGR